MIHVEGKGVFGFPDPKAQFSLRRSFAPNEHELKAKASFMSFLMEDASRFFGPGAAGGSDTKQFI